MISRRSLLAMLLAPLWSRPMLAERPLPWEKWVSEGQIIGFDESHEHDSSALVETFIDARGIRVTRTLQ